MAGNIGTYLANAALNLLRATNITAPATMYLALFTGTPGDAYTTANEVASAGAYIREAINFDTAATRSTDNSDAVTFPVATTDWTTVSHVGILDTGTHGTGNLFWHGALTTPKAIGTGDQFKINAGDLDLSFTAS